MKFVIAAVCACVLAVGAYFVSQKSSTQAQAPVRNEWKYSAVEKENTVRPEMHEGMKFDPAQVRAPASNKKK